MQFIIHCSCQLYHVSRSIDCKMVLYCAATKKFGGGNSFCSEQLFFFYLFEVFTRFRSRVFSIFVRKTGLNRGWFYKVVINGKKNIFFFDINFFLLVFSLRNYEQINFVVGVFFCFFLFMAKIIFPS